MKTHKTRNWGLSILYILLFLAVFIPLLDTAAAPHHYGTELTETGTNDSAHTIFTNPGENSSTMMNISFATPVGTTAIVEVYEDMDTLRFPSEGVRCETFDSIYSQLKDGRNIYERHIFDKHDVVLRGLKPDTQYSYSIVTDSAGFKERSERHEFKTAGAKVWKAAIIGDFHHYSPMWSRLESAMGMLNVLDSVSGGFDWVLTTGDVSSWGGSYNFWTELSEQPAFQNYMWANVQGNHDHATRDKEKSDAFFRDSHAFPHNGYPGQEGVTYWFKYGDVLFLMLNNEAMRGPGHLEETKEWMEKVVHENPSKYIVVVEHSEWLIGTDGKTSNIARFHDLFDKLGVDLAISGNNHAYLRTYPVYEVAAVQPGEGTYYVVTPSSDNDRGRALNPLKANHDIIAQRWSEGKHTVGGMLMDVNDNRIVLTLYDRYGNVQDTFTAPARR